MRLYIIINNIILQMYYNYCVAGWILKHWAKVREPQWWVFAERSVGRKETPKGYVGVRRVKALEVEEPAGLCWPRRPVKARFETSLSRTYTISHDDWLRESEAAMYTYDTYSFPTVRKDLTLRLQFRFFNMNHRKPALIQWKVATRCVVDRQQRMRLFAFLLPREGRRGSLTADCTFTASLTQLPRQIAALSRKSWASVYVWASERTSSRLFKQRSGMESLGIEVE